MLRPFGHSESEKYQRPLPPLILEGEEVKSEKYATTL